MQLIKHVFPRFIRPRSPVVEFLLKPSLKKTQLNVRAPLRVNG